jgi:hypothetical protein
MGLVKNFIDSSVIGLKCEGFKCERVLRFGMWKGKQKELEYDEEAFDWLKFFVL